MVRKLNRKAAEAYTEDFSSKVLDNFFSAHQAASGQDILELTPVQQVNLLIIQRLYQRWQEETRCLRSAYFNFEHPEVQESLQSFMNTLSRHILVERDSLEPFLKTAVMDTLRLLFNPMAFFDEFLRLYPRQETMQASLRYLRLQQPLTDVLQEHIEDKTTSEPEYLLAMLEAGIRSGKLELDPVDEHVQAFAQVLPLPQQIADEPLEPTPARPAKETPADNTNFFSSISQMASRTPKPAPKLVAAAEDTPPPAAKPKTAPAAAKETLIVGPGPAKNTRAQTVMVQPVPEEPVRKASIPAPVEKRPAPAPAATPQRKEADNHNLNKRFERNEKKPLYEKFEPKESRSSSLSQNQRTGNIRNYISLNQRFMFIKELFGSDAAAFTAALNALDDCQNLREARQWVQGNLAPLPQWQPDSEAVQEFELVLEQRFSA